MKPSSEFTEGVEVDIETVVKLLSPYKGVQKVLLDIFKSRNKGNNKNFAFVPTKASNIENRVGAFSYYPSGEKLTNKDAGLSGDPNAVSPYTGVIMLSIETLEAAKTSKEEAAKLKEAFLEETVHALTAMGLETKDIQNSEEYTGLVNVINQINDLVNSGQIELTPSERKEFEYRVSLKLLDANQTTTPNLVAEFMLLPYTDAGKSLLKKAQDAGVTFSKDVSPEAENLLDAIKSLISKITEKIAAMFRNQDPSLEERITIDTLAIAMNKVRANATMPSISEALVTVPIAQQPDIRTTFVKKVKVDIPAKSKENKEKTIKAAKDLNKYYGNITSLNLGDVVINQIDDVEGKSDYYKNVIIPLGAVLHHKIVKNAIHKPIIRNFRDIKDNQNNTYTLKGEIALAENEDLYTVVEITLSKELLNDYFDKKEKADTARAEYVKLGLKDINQAMRGVDASVSTAESKLNNLLIDKINAKYNEESFAIEAAPSISIASKRVAILEGINKSEKDKLDITEEQLLNLIEGINLENKISVAAIQRILKIGYNRALRISEKIDVELSALGETTAQTQEDVSDDFSLFGEEEAIPETPAKTSNEDPTPKTARVKPRIGASGPRKLKSMTEAFNSGFDSPEATALMFKKKNVVKSAADHADMIASTMLWEQDLFTAFSIGDVSAEDIVSAVKEELQYELENSDSRRKNFLSYLINNIDEVWIKNSQLFKLYDVETKADSEEVSGELDDIAKDGESGAEVNKSSTENTLDGEEISKYQERTEQRLSSLEEIGKYARLFTRMIPKIKLEKGAPVMQTVKRIIEREDEEGNIIEKEITVTEPVLFTDNLGNFKPADYTSLWNAIADAVQGCLTFDEMLQSLKSTYYKVPEMAIFVSRLEALPDSREGTIIIKNIEKSLQRVYIPTKLIAEKESSRSVGMALTKEERSKMKGTMGEAVPTFPSTRIVPIVGKEYKKFIYKGATPKSANTVEYYIYDGGKNDSINIQNIIVSELRSTLKSLAVEGSGTIDYVKLHKLLKEKVRFNNKTNILEKEPVIKMWEEWGLTLPANLTPDLRKAAVNSLVDFTTQLYVKLNNMESSKGAAVDSKVQSFDLFEFVRTTEFGFKGALGAVRNLLDSLSKILPYATSNMTKNAEGENQSNLHNFSSFLLYIKYINQLQNATAAEKEKIYKIMPRLKNPIAKYSWVLKNTKGGEKVAAVNISGTKEGNKGKLTINLDFITYMKQSFETLFGQGYKENIRAETATTSFGFTILSNKVILPIDPTEDINDKMYNIFSGYLKGEVERIYAEKTSTTKYEFKYEKSKKDFTFLKDVLSEELKNKIQGVIDSQVVAGTDLNMKEIFSIEGFDKMLKRDLIDYKKREREEFKKFVVETTGLLVDSGHPIFNTIGVRKAYDSISQRSNEDKLDTFIDYFLMNGVVLGIEEIILFHGELGQFDKFYKRSKSTISNGTPVVINNALHNVLQNTAVGVTFSEVVTGKKPEYYTTPEEMNSMVIEEDIMVPSQEQRENMLSGAIYSLTETAKEFNTGQPKAQILARANEIVDGYGFFKDEEGEAVGGATVGDGGALIHPDAYRMILWGVDSWNIEHEEGYQYLAIKYKMKKGMSISESDKETFDYVQEKIDRLGYYFQFPPIKFQYRGPGKQVMIVNGVETEVKTPVAIEMLDKFALTPAFPEAIENSLGEDLFDVMTENNIAYVKFPSATKIGSFENNKLSEIKKGYKPKGVHKLTTVFLKEQVKTPTGLKTKTLNGSQQRKLIISNIFTKDGIMDGLGEFYETWVGSQRKIADQARKKLRKDLGTKIVNGKAEVDVKKLLVLLREEVDKRELPEALRDFFDRDGLNSDDAIFELSLSPKIVENMIYSLLKNRIVKEKFPGSQLIQTPSSFFSRKGIQDPMTNNRDLKFYRIDPDTGEVLPAQCKMTLHGPFLNLLNLPEVQEKGGNIEALNELLKDPTFVETHRKSLTVYSYRIPTQGYNSKDILEIAEFLPGYLGNMLVPPPQIVIKSGTDYDYDKMPTMFPNIDKNGYYIGEDSIKAEYEELSDKDAAKLKDSLKQQLRNLYKANLRQVVLENKEQLKAAFERGLNPDTLNTVTDPEERKRLTSLFTQGKVYMQEALKYLNTEFEMQKELVERLRYYRDKSVPMKVRREKYKQEFGKTLDLTQLNKDNDKAHKDLHTIINQQKVGRSYLKNLESAPYNPSAVPLVNEYQEQFTQIKNELVILSNSRKPQVVHHNKMIEAAKGLLLDRKNFHRLIAPNTTDYVVGALEKVLQTLYNTSGQVNPEPTNSKVFSFITHLKKWGAVKIKDLLGIAAVNNTFYALMQEARTKFNNSIFIGDNEYKDIYPLLSEEETKMVDSTNPFMIGESIDKLEIINQFINLFVDAASNDIAGYTNIIRNNVGFVIYQTVLGIPFDRVLSFLHQPIIYQYNQYIEFLRSEGVNSGDIRRLAFERFFKIAPERKNKAQKIIPKSKDRLFAELSKFYPKDRISKEYLDKNIVSKDKIIYEYTDNDIQNSILAYYIVGLEQAEAMREVQSFVNFDTTLVQSSKMSEVRERKLNKIEESNLITVEGALKIKKDSVISHLDVHEDFVELSNAVFPIKNEPNFVYNAAAIIEKAKGSDQEALATTMENDLLLYIIQNFSNDGNFNQEKYERLKGLIDNASLMNRWTELKNKYKLEDLNLSRKIYDVTNSNGGANPAIFMGIDNDPIAFDSILYEIREMLSLPGDDTRSVELRGFAQDLVELGFFQTGYNTSVLYMLKVLPPEYTEAFKGAFKTFINLDVNKKSSIYKSFFKMFLVKRANGVASSVVSDEIKRLAKLMGHNGVLVNYLEPIIPDADNDIQRTAEYINPFPSMQDQMNEAKQLESQYKAVDKNALINFFAENEIADITFTEDDGTICNF